MIGAIAGIGAALGGLACGKNSMFEAGSEDQPLSEPALGGLLAKFVDDEQAVGIVVGVVSPAGRMVVAHGRLAEDDLREPDGDTVFEIGSITKVFTSTLLAELASRGEVDLDTPVQHLLGSGARMPTRDGAEITLGHLATHSSGLPRLPDNLDPDDRANPYADYTVERLYDFLSSHELKRDIGAKVEYSNLGFGLLGHALARSQGTDYPTLVYERISEPLRMADTTVVLTTAHQARLAAGHDKWRFPAPNWNFAALAGAGALRSTVNDMLTFLEANLGIRETPLRPAMERTHIPQRADPTIGMDIGLGWVVHDTDDGRVAWHNGGTGGYSSFIGFDPASQAGVVVLSNTAISVDELGFHLLTRAAIE